MNTSDSEDLDSDINRKYYTLNFVVSLLLILLTFSVSILNNTLVIPIIALPAMFILTYLEEKYNFTVKSYSRFVYLINCTIILILIIFWIFSAYFGLNFINIQFIIFNLSFYFILQIFVKFDYFKERNILIVQNIFAVATFTIILYSFFPFIELIYIDFTSNPILILVSNVMIHSIIILIITLISFYFLYARIKLYKKPWKLFNYIIITVFLLIEIIGFTLLNIRNFHLGVPIFQRSLIVSTILLSISFLIFVLFNYIIRVFTRELSLLLVYYSCWFLFSSIFLVLIVLYWSNIVIVFFDLILVTVLSLLNLKFGTYLKKIKEKTFLKLVKFSFYALLLEIYLLFYGIFNYFFFLNIIISLFLSLCIIGAIFNLLSYYEKVISRKIRIIITSFIFFSDISIVIFYYINANIEYFYVYLVLPIILCFLFYIPIYYLYKEDVIKKKVLALYSYLSSWALTIIIFTLNFFIIVAYFYADLLLGSLLNFLFLTFCLVVLTSFGRKIKRLKESSSRVILNFLSYPIMVEIFILLFTVFTFYLRLDVFLSSFMSLSIISFIFYLLTKQEKLFPKFPKIVLNTITFYFGVFIAGYYSVLFTLGTYFLYFIPLIIISVLSYLPIFYLYKKTVLNRNTFLKYHFFCSIIISLAIFAFNFFTIFNFFNVFIVFLIVVNILYISVVSYYISKLGVKVNIVSKEFFKKFSTFINILIIIEAYAILYSIFNQELLIEPVLSAYFSTIPICFLINVLSRSRIIFSDKSAIGINILTLTFTSALISYYVYLFTYNSILVFILPPLVFSVLMLAPLYYSLRKRIFRKFIEKVLLVDSLLIWMLIVSLPTIISLELMRIGIIIDYSFILIPTIILIFGVSRYIEFLVDKYKVKEKYVVTLKSIQIIIFIALAISICLRIFQLIYTLTLNYWLSLGSSCLTFLVVNLINLVPLENLKQRIFENEGSKYDYYKIYKIFEYTKNLSFFAIIISLAFIITLLIPTQFLVSLLHLPEPALILAVSNIGVFIVLYLILSVIGGTLFKVNFIKLKSTFELSAWIFVNFLVFLYIFVLPIQFSLLLRITIPLVITIFMFPITLYYLQKLTFISERTLKFSKKLLFYLFSGGLIVIFVYLFWLYSNAIPFFSSNLALQVFLAGCCIYLFLNFYLLKFDAVVERATEFRIVKIFSGSFLVLFSLFSVFPNFLDYISYAVFTIAIIVLLLNRNRNYLTRTIYYLSLSAFIFIKAVVTLNQYMLIPSFSFTYITLYSFIYSFSLMGMLFLSILINLKKVNVVEKFALYFLISLNCLILLILNTVIPLIYNISISVFIFLLLTSNFFYRQKDERYKWFIRPCVLLFAFGLVSYLSFYILFNNSLFQAFNPILTFTLTSTITGIAYVGTYNKTPEKFRRISFYIAFSVYIISFPTFMYFFLNALFSLQLWDTILFLITINMGIALFYISIGVYY